MTEQERTIGEYKWVQLRAKKAANLILGLGAWPPVLMVLLLFSVPGFNIRIQYYGFIENLQDPMSFLVSTGIFSIPLFVAFLFYRVRLFEHHLSTAMTGVISSMTLTLFSVLVLAMSMTMISPALVAVSAIPIFITMILLTREMLWLSAWDVYPRQPLFYALFMIYNVPAWARRVLRAMQPITLGILFYVLFMMWFSARTKDLSYVYPWDEGFYPTGKTFYEWFGPFLAMTTTTLVAALAGDVFMRTAKIKKGLIRWGYVATISLVFGMAAVGTYRVIYDSDFHAAQQLLPGFKDSITMQLRASQDINAYLINAVLLFPMAFLLPLARPRNCLKLLGNSNIIKRKPLYLMIGIIAKISLAAVILDAIFGGLGIANPDYSSPAMLPMMSILRTALAIGVIVGVHMGGKYPWKISFLASILCFVGGYIIFGALPRDPSGMMTMLSDYPHVWVFAGLCIAGFYMLARTLTHNVRKENPFN